jgi:hypothetical protein
MKNNHKESNITVLPDPVTAQAIKSLLAKITAIDPFWTGVGLTYPAFFMLSSNNVRNPASSKDVMYCGTSEPVTCRKKNKILMFLKISLGIQPEGQSYQNF